MKTSTVKTAILSALVSLPAGTVCAPACAQGFESERIARFITAEDGLTNRQPRIRNNFVHHIVEDSFRRIWVASEGGLDVISIQDFINCDILGALPDDIVASSISALAKSSDGCIWVVVGDRVVRFLFDEMGNVASTMIYRDERILPNYVTVKDVERNGSVWIGIEGQVFRLSVRPVVK